VTPLPVNITTPIVEVPSPQPLTPAATVINEKVEIPNTVIKSAAIPLSNMLGSLLKRGFGSDDPDIELYQSGKREIDHGGLNNTATPACEDRNDFFNVRRLSPIPEHYMAQMDTNISVVRMYEKIADDFVEWMNQKEHVSDCALINLQSRQFRPTTDAEVVERRNRNSDFVNEYLKETSE
jgi:hypothetical protein